MPTEVERIEIATCSGGALAFAVVGRKLRILYAASPGARPQVTERELPPGVRPIAVGTGPSFISDAGDMFLWRANGKRPGGEWVLVLNVNEVPDAR